MTTMTVAACRRLRAEDRKATLANRSKELLADPAVRAATWSCSPRIRARYAELDRRGTDLDGDEKWFAMLADQAVVVPSERPPIDSGSVARGAGVYLVIGVNEREPTGSTIYKHVCCTSTPTAPHREAPQLMPTGSERTVWGMGDGSTLDTYPTPFGGSVG